MLAVVASARASATLLSGRGYLVPGASHLSLPRAHVPVGYCRQNGRCCLLVRQPQHSYNGDLVSHTQRKVLAGRKPTKPKRFAGALKNYSPKLTLTKSSLPAKSTITRHGCDRSRSPRKCIEKSRVKAEAPNSKHQAPTKFQIPSSKKE